jgi:predicted metalloprotease
MRVSGPMKLGGAGLILALIVMLLGGDPSALLNVIGGTPTTMQQTQAGAEPTDEGGEFVARVLGDTEDTWTRLFTEAGRAYDAPVLVLFTDAVQSACGFNSAAVGPFYCPADRKVYIDLGFYRELHDRFGAPGDFAQAYVIAHEVGHHVQNLLGTAERVHGMRARASEEEGNALSVRMELQADCYAGIWGYYARTERNLLEQGDIDEALNAAAAIGDDRMQRSAGRAVTPESWTHGSSEQRARWFRRGFEGGRVDACDTFSARTL